MALRGDFRELRQLRIRVRSIAEPHVRTELAQVLGATALKLVSDGFRKSVDPYGKPWKPVERKRGKDRRARARRARAGKPVLGDKPLIDTGRLRASFHPSALSASPLGFTIATDVQYASFHQDGTRRIAQRMMLPSSEGGGLGPIWERALNAEAERFMRRLLGGQ